MSQKALPRRLTLRFLTLERAVTATTRMPRPLRADDTDGVVYLGTFSKTFAAGVRVGWAVAPTAIREKLILAAESAVLCHSSFSQLTVREYLNTQPWLEQIKDFRELYRERRDAMLSALSRLIGRLAGHGLVERGLCDMDRRGIYVLLTERGRQRHAETPSTSVAPAMPAPRSRSRDAASRRARRRSCPAPARHSCLIFAPALTRPIVRSEKARTRCWG